MTNPVLDYASVVWSPCKKAQIDNIEAVQRKFTKRISSLRNVSYIDRLNALSLESLQMRRNNHDILFVCSIITSNVPHMHMLFRLQRDNTNKPIRGFCDFARFLCLYVRKYSTWASCSGNKQHIESDVHECLLCSSTSIYERATRSMKGIRRFISDLPTAKCDLQSRKYEAGFYINLRMPLLATISCCMSTIDGSLLSTSRLKNVTRS